MARDASAPDHLWLWVRAEENEISRRIHDSTAHRLVSSVAVPAKLVIDRELEITFTVKLQEDLLARIGAGDEPFKGQVLALEDNIRIYSKIKALSLIG